ncbi:DUF2914 domain-containing protein [Candidatus Parcubacteria bacterium]|nr:DUF2914 domain-containing protein [Candidatus Parcubacteria bacterium]
MSNTKKHSKLRHWYETYERRLSVASLIGGFIFDSLTMQRVDNLWDNLWITFNIFLSAYCVIMLSRNKEREEGFWLPNILQFSFGALFGSIFVFYLRSSALSATWPFIALLLFALLINEFFQKRYTQLALRLSFLYFAIFSFSIFLMPIATKSLNDGVFVLSGLVSLAVLWVLLKLIVRFARESFIENRTHIWSFVTVIFVGINTLYFTNLIPPIPLSLKDSGIYHSVERDSRGNYVVGEEEMGWEKYLPFAIKIHLGSGEPLYAYTAVYSPGSLNTNIVHKWQYKDNKGEWQTSTEIPLFLAGGRVEGFRTFSHKYQFTPGDWRVSVETPRGQVISRINFKVLSSTGSSTLVYSVKK